MSSFKLWLKYAKPTAGRLLVDEGAERAARARTSLLPVGVVEVEGEFEAGDAVEVLRRPRRRQGDRGLLGGRAASHQGAEDRRCARAVAAGDRGGRPPRLLRARWKPPSPPPAWPLHSPYDREILKLALPALGALAAEPLYLLADTAMVGHLGTEELAALAIAATLLAGAFTLFNFLTYGTTAQVARLHGAGEEEAAGGSRRRRSGSRGRSGSRWRSLAAGLAVPLVDLMGGDGRRATSPSSTCGSARSARSR